MRDLTEGFPPTCAKLLLPANPAKIQPLGQVDYLPRRLLIDASERVSLGHKVEIILGFGNGSYRTKADACESTMRGRYVPTTDP
jgi:hypothetical protein